jgi:transcription termination factor Rho
MRSGTRREEMLLSDREWEAMYTIREMSGRVTSGELTEQVIDILSKSRDNREFVNSIASLRINKNTPMPREKPLAYHG